MRFMVDESSGPAVARWLVEQGHEVFSVYDELRGAEDELLLKKALEGGWIVITLDKDFGEKVFRERRPHAGVILLRLRNQRAGERLNAVENLLRQYADRLVNEFVVVTERRVRFART